MKRKIIIVILLSVILLVFSFAFIGQKVNKQENEIELNKTINSGTKTIEISSIQEEKILREEEYPQDDVKIEKKKQECEFVISCVSLLDKKLKKQIPKDGMIFHDRIEISESVSAYDLLKRVTRDNKIQIEVSETPLYESIYIEGIDNIYEFDYGPTSGWTYSVNGLALDIGANKYIVKAGDKIEFIYVTEWQSDV